MASVAQQQSQSQLSRDELFDVLGNERRRCIIQYILEQGDEVQIDSLVEHLAAWENNKRVAELSSGERKRVYSALQQSHLPKMEELGLIEYRQDSGTIQTADSFTEINVYLQAVGGRVPFSLIYMGLSVTSLTLLLGAMMGVPLISTVPLLWWAAIVIVVFGISSAIHLLYTRRMELVPDFRTQSGDN